MSDSVNIVNIDEKLSTIIKYKKLCIENSM